MQTLALIGRRILYAALLLLAVIVLNFTLIRLAPGDIVQTIAGQMGGMNEELMLELRHSFQLDKSIPEQLLILHRQGRARRSRLQLFLQPARSRPHSGPGGATVLLVFSSLVLSVVAGTLLGTLASRRLYGPFSHAVTVVTLIGWSMPVFWLGILLLIAFAWVFPVFPVSGMFTVGLEGGFWTRALDVGRHIALPMFTLSFIYIAQYALLARSVMVEVLGADYIRTARAKGLPERSVIWKHALRNAVLPVVTMAGLQMGYLLSGAIMVETVFSWPGLGQLAFESILRRDTPTILGILFFSTFMVIAANLLTDFACRLLDPRIRAER
ncbi:MAG: ABC transporter permease [Bilophila wadsworthia]